MKIYQFALSLGVAALLFPLGGGQVLAMDPDMIVHNMFKELDTNYDGYIDRREADDDLSRNFNAYDQNGDGRISQDEAYEYFEGMVDDINSRLPEMSPPG